MYFSVSLSLSLHLLLDIYLYVSSLFFFFVCVFLFLMYLWQTGTGKTYTLSNTGDSETMGIIPRSVSNIFQTVAAESADGKREYCVRMEFIQIYMEAVELFLSCYSNVSLKKLFLASRLDSRLAQSSELGNSHS